MPRTRLSARELEVVECASRGLTDKQIGQELGVSPGTVHTHWARILAKLKARSRAEAVAWIHSANSAASSPDKDETYASRQVAGSNDEPAATATAPDLAESILRELPLVVLVLSLRNMSIVATFGQTYDAFGVFASELRDSGMGLIQERVHPEDLPGVLAHLEEARFLRHGRIFQNEFRVRSAAGRWNWVETRSVPLDVGPEGLVETLLVVCRNTTWRRESELAAQAALDHANRQIELLSKAWEAFVGGVVVLDEDRTVVRANSVAARTLGMGTDHAGLADRMLVGSPGERRPWPSSDHATSWYPLHDRAGRLLGYVVFLELDARIGDRVSDLDA